MPRALRRLWPWLAAALLLAACSKGGDGGASQPTCTRWTPAAGAGPGDPRRYFPLAPGDRWTIRTAAVEGGEETWHALQVTGTRPILGWDAAVLAASELDQGWPLGETYRAVDDHGVVELGNDDALDTLTPLLVPHYAARFPLAVGDEFTAAECSNLDFGADLDGDGKNERFDLRLAISVRAVEPIATPVASFPEAARLEQRLTLTVRASGSAQQETAEARSTDWVVPGVGPVREVVEEPMGSPRPPLELVGWSVDEVAKGLLARRQLAAEVVGPYASTPWGEGFLVAGRKPGDPSRVVGLEVLPDGSAVRSLEVLAVPGGGPLELSPPALAAGAGGVVVAVASSWYGTGGDALLQRIGATGAILEPPAGKVIGPAASYWGDGCGPALASDGTGFLAAWVAPDGLRVVQLGADGVAARETVVAGGCAVAAFDGTGYLLVYEAAEELRAVHVTAAGEVVEQSALVLSATPGTKHPIAMVFAGAEHVLLLADGRDGRSTALTLRRLSAAGAWIDGDALTGGLVLLPRWISTNHASSYGESVTLAGATPVVAWATGEDTQPPVPAEEAWVTRLGPDGAPLDLHGGLPGVDAFLGDPLRCGGPRFPLALGGADGIPAVLYSAECGWPAAYTQILRAVRFGL